MKRSVSIAAVSAISVAVGFAACNSSDSGSATTAQAAAQSQAWSLTYKADCSSASDAAQCTGAYGFTVNADGTYQVGPAPKGETTGGKLDADDFSELMHDASSVVDGTAQPAPGAQDNCNAFDSSDSDYNLTLTRHGASATVLHKSGSNLCSDRLDQDAAQTLDQEIVSLAQKYYPAIFPDACVEAAQAVSAMYPAVQKCNGDSDCGYLDLNYQAIPSDTDDTVYADNCSVVSNLPAANVSAVQAHLADLQKALQNAQQVCGIRIARDGCEGVKSFDSTTAPAVCRQGVCQVNPSLGF